MTLQMIEEPCCKNCRFWIGKYNMGRCHRYPPQFWSEAGCCGADFVGIDGSEWCGEFQPTGWTVPKGVCF